MAVLLATMIFRLPDIILCLVLFPLFAVVTMGISIGLIFQFLTLCTLVFLRSSGVFPTSDWLPQYSYVLIGSTTTCLVSWISIRSVVTLIGWALYSYEEGRKQVNEALEQRVELKQVQEDLIHANKDLAQLSVRLRAMTYLAEDARRVKEEFVAKVSHELRTPLNMIIGFCEMISQSPRTYGGKLPPLLLADIAAIQRNSQHLAGLVNDVLDLSQVEAGKLALSKEWFSLPDAIQEAVEAVRALFSSKKLSLTTEMSVPDINVFADHLRVREVIINLLSNAARFTEQGGVVIRCWQSNGKVIVCVTDTGPGIAKVDQQRVFEPFQQHDNSTHRKYGGSGLGLTISKQLIDMHGGTMWLESELRKGSSFFFSLPVNEPPELSIAVNANPLRWINPYDAYEPRTRRSKAPVPEFRPRYIILESGNVLLRYFQRYLDDVEVVPTGSVEEVLIYLQKSPAQAIIINTPDHQDHACEVERMLRFNSLNTPVISCWVPGSDDAARKLGVMHYLVKPVSREKILSAIGSIPGQPKNILLVDDNLEELQLFIRVLSSSSVKYSVIRAINGKQALNMLRERHPDLMILDLVMEGLDGFHVLEEKNRDPEIRDIPVIIFSSLDPTGVPIATSSLTVMKSGGISIKELVTGVEVLSQVLTPNTQQFSPTSSAGFPE